MLPDQDRFPRFTISMIVVIGFMAVIAAFFMLPMKGDVAWFTTLVGVLAAAFKDVVGYHINSSSGSKAKDAALLAAQPPAPAPEKPAVQP